MEKVHQEDPLWLHDVGLVRYKLNTLPLLQRGWVLQEPLLSPRTLLFGKNGIFWGVKGILRTKAIRRKYLRRLDLICQKISMTSRVAPVR